MVFHQIILIIKLKNKNISNWKWQCKVNELSCTDESYYQVSINNIQYLMFSISNLFSESLSILIYSTFSHLYIIIIWKEYVCVIFNLLGSSQYVEDLLGPRASEQQITNHSRIYLLTRSKNAQEVATSIKLL